MGETIAMALSFQPALGRSVWVDYESPGKTQDEIADELRAGRDRGEWVAWRIVRPVAEGC